MCKRVENLHFLISSAKNYPFLEIAWRMDRLVRLEKTSKNVKAVDAHHYTCITLTTTTTTTKTGYVPVKAAIKGLLPKIDYRNLVGDSIILYPRMII